jgi:Mg2+ and Co2+ transporter CorA
VSNETPWVDLLDPSEDELDRHLPEDIHSSALTRLRAPARPGDEPRPRLESQGDYAFGVFLVPVVDRKADVVFYQEVDIVMTRDVVITVRKTPEGGRPPYDSSGARDACRGEAILPSSSTASSTTSPSASST